MIKYNNRVNWNVGCFLTDVGDAMLDVLSWLRDYGFEIPKMDVFGSPVCRYNGGRLMLGKKIHIDDIAKYVMGFNDYGIGCRLTYQSTEIRSVNDTYCIEMLEVLKEYNASGKNGVILSSDLLNDYLKENYPMLKRISSLVKPAVEVGLINDQPDYYNQLIKEYDYVVVNASRVFDRSFLDKIEDISKIEVIVNSTCIKNCPLAGEHYRFNSETSDRFADYKGLGYSFDQEYFFNSCGRVKELSKGDAMLMMSQNQVSELVDRGVVNLKLEGRNLDKHILLADIARYIFTDRIYKFNRNYF